MTAPFTLGIRLTADPDNNTPRAWVHRVAAARDAGAHYVTLEDTFHYTENTPTGQLDATLLASFIAPQVPGIGLIPSANTTHTEPFHIQKNIATLDHISHGFAGWQATVSDSEEATTLVGRRQQVPTTEELYREAEEFIDVSRRLWDSWEDDAEIRDAGTGRFIDRDKVHYVDYVGTFFSIKGPTITPRSPQGQPPVVLSGRSQRLIEAAARAADVLIVPVTDAADAEELLSQIRQVEAQGRHSSGLPTSLIVHADLDDDARSLTIEQLRTLGYQGVRLPQTLPADTRQTIDTAPAGAGSLRAVLGLSPVKPRSRYLTTEQKGPVLV